LGEQAVDLTSDQRVVLAGQDMLAGSALRMDHGVRNLMKLAGVSLADAVAMATINPARVTGIDGRRNGLSPGDRADFVMFRFDRESLAIQVEETYVSGDRVYRGSGLENANR
jgi:N-acetylglucosamine-6-phosphate deacetylase